MSASKAIQENQTRILTIELEVWQGAESDVVHSLVVRYNNLKI